MKSRCGDKQTSQAQSWAKKSTLGWVWEGCLKRRDGSLPEDLSEPCDKHKLGNAPFTVTILYVIEDHFVLYEMAIIAISLCTHQKGSTRRYVRDSLPCTHSCRSPPGPAAPPQGPGRAWSLTPGGTAGFLWQPGNQPRTECHQWVHTRTFIPAELSFTFGCFVHHSKCGLPVF